MVHTRGQGARPEGFSEYSPPKRERRPKAPSRSSPPPPSTPLTRDERVRRLFPPLAAPATPSFVSTGTDPMPPSYTSVSTQTDIDLTNFPEPSTGKRRRAEEEDEAASSSSSKRARNAGTPPAKPKPFFNSSWKTRSILSVPSKPSIMGSPSGNNPRLFRPEPLHESPFYNQILKPTNGDKQQSKAADEDAPQTPQPSKQQQPTTEAGLFGSVKKIFGLFKGSASKTESATATEPQSPSPSPHDSPQSRPELDFSSPTAAARYTPGSPETATSQPAHQLAYDQFFKRRRYGETRSGQAYLAAKAREQEESEFAETPGSKKRKLASLDGKIPGPRAGGFGIDDSYLDVDNEVEGIDGEISPSTPSKLSTQPYTPLRSALRQNGTIARTGKSVRINPTTAVKHVYGSYGPAGQYHGSVFTDASTPTDSSISADNIQSMLSPNTINNTLFNQTPRFRLDTNIFDPNDENWRPSLANPTPGHFRVPEDDEFDDFDDTELSLLEKEQRMRREQDQVPPQPSTPRMSHAELPQQSPPSAVSSFTEHNDSVMVSDTQEIRLNKARSDAQKYKPVRSSRLSHGEPARSRSSSPPFADDDFTASNLVVSTPGGLPPSFYDARMLNTPLDETPAKPPGREDLDNSIVGEDGMTEYQREHQFDEWAKDIFSKVPVQTYQEAGIASSYIADLVQKNWTQKDTDDSIDFWSKEFDDGIRADQEARAQGKRLVWVTDPADMN